MLIFLLRMIAQKLRSAFLWPDRAFLAFPGNGINAYFNMDEKIFGFDPDKRHCPEDCSKTGYEVAEVSVPVEVLPVTKVGEVETDCCGEPHVSCECDPCTNTCKIVITQRIKIKIPVKIGIKTFTGESQICCVPGHCLGEEEKE